MKSTISVEQQILYVLFTNPHLVAKCNLTSADFSQQTDQIIYQSILDVANQNLAVDVVSVAEHIEKMHRQVDMGYLVALHARGIGAASSFDQYQDMIRSGARKRKAKQIAFNLQHQIENGSEGIDPVQHAIRELMDIDRDQKSYDRTIGQCLKAGLEQVQTAMDCGGMVGITTGLKGLDESITGYHKTDLYVIGARPSVGKTAFLFSSALASNAVVGIISAEQDHAQAGLRCISIVGSVNSQNLRSAKLSNNEWSRVTAGTVSTQDRPIFLNDEPGIGITNLIRQARIWKFNHGLEILFVDYIQKIKGSNTRATRVEQVTEVTQALKQLARELQIPVVALAQVKRDVDTRTDKRPTIGDMADASEIEKEADAILTLYRDEVYNPESQDKGLAEIFVCKNRHGPTGMIKCQFIGKYFQFKDFNRPYSESHYE